VLLLGLLYNYCYYYYYYCHYHHQHHRRAETIITTTTKVEVPVLNSEIYKVNVRDSCNIALNFSTRWEQCPRFRCWSLYPRKKENPVPNEQAVGVPLRRSERGEITIIVIKFENCNLLKYVLVLFIRYKLNTRMMNVIYGTTDAEFQMTGVTQNIPGQLNSSG